VVDDMMMTMMELKEDDIEIYQLLNKENENVLDVHNLNRK
jgi:predicted transcriptional regulator